MRRRVVWIAGSGILLVGGVVWSTVVPPPPFLPSSATTNQPDPPRGAAAEHPSQRRIAARQEPTASLPPPAAVGSSREESDRAEPPQEESDQEESDQEESDQEEGQIRPHPDSPQRTEQLAHRTQFERIDQALASGQLDTAQLLLEEQERSVADHPSWDDWVLGYRVILNCRREPGADATRAAVAFEADHPASRMRRRVRRACLP